MALGIEDVMLGLSKCLDRSIAIQLREEEQGDGDVHSSMFCAETNEVGVLGQHPVGLYRQENGGNISIMNPKKTET